MRLLRLTVLLILAIIVIVEPVVHSHPLIPGFGSDSSGLASSTICAICAVGAGNAVVSAQAVVAPLIVIERVVTSSLLPIANVTRASLASRAPPAA